MQFGEETPVNVLKVILSYLYRILFDYKDCNFLSSSCEFLLITQTWLLDSREGIQFPLTMLHFPLTIFSNDFYKAGRNIFLHK